MFNGLNMVEQGSLRSRVDSFSLGLFIACKLTWAGSVSSKLIEATKRLTPRFTEAHRLDISLELDGSPLVKRIH